MIRPKQWLRELRWAWQRVTRGWDDTVTWSIDMHLNEMLPQWLRILRDYGLGAPGCMIDPEDWDDEKCKYKPGALERAEARWHDILTRMIDGFEAGYRLDRFEWQNDDERKQLEAQLDEALKLFAEYYRCLWD
jgi:hypothetical protein